jgi:hypothetical protein
MGRLCGHDAGIVEQPMDRHFLVPFDFSTIARGNIGKQFSHIALRTIHGASAGALVLSQHTAAQQGA